jgi:hypothetical protein
MMGMISDCLVLFTIVWRELNFQQNRSETGTLNTGGCEDTRYHIVIGIKLRTLQTVIAIHTPFLIRQSVRPPGRVIDEVDGPRLTEQTENSATLVTGAGGEDLRDLKRPHHRAGKHSGRGGAIGTKHSRLQTSFKSYFASRTILSVLEILVAPIE